MRRLRWRALLCGLVAATPLLALACSNIFGIEERTYSPPSSLCELYCGEAMERCQGEHQLYASVDTCLATCRLLPPGAKDDTRGNTVECRRSQLKLVQQTGEPSDYCRRAGPGGDGVCGSNCEGYCAIMLPVCGTAYFDTPESCVEACRALPDHHDYSVQAPTDGSVQCRLYHVTSASVDTAHCVHAGGEEKCVDPDAGAPPGEPDADTDAGAGGGS